MATQAPISVADAEASIVALRDALVDGASLDRSATLRTLRELHMTLLRATPSSPAAPENLLRLAQTAIDGVPEDRTDALAPRLRTALRLLRVGSLPAAWEVLAENATGVVTDEFDVSTATGAARTSWRLPLLTRIDAGTVYAELPGFRDPRYDAPDGCYDITDTIGVKHHLDEIDAVGGAIRLGGWVALDVLAANPAERVAVIAASRAEELAVAARRVRRADLVTGSGEGLTRRVWAGWSACLDLADPQFRPGAWELSLQIDHDGVVRRVRVGRNASDLARAATAAPMRIGKRTVRWETGDRQWRLVIEPS